MYNEAVMWLDSLNPASVWFLALFSLAIYFFPAFLVFSRQHPHRYGFLILNAMLGWTGIGWVVLLSYSITLYSYQFDNALEGGYEPKK